MSIQGALNYRPSNSATYYTPSRQFHVGRTLVGMVGAAVAIIAGAWLYATVQPRFSNVYLIVGGVAAAAAATGGLCVIPIRYGQVSSSILAAFIGSFLGVLSLYVIWLVWAHHSLQRWNVSVPYWSLISSPPFFLKVIKAIHEIGTWQTSSGTTVRGPVLLFLWLIEAGAILACAVLFPVFCLGTLDPRCRECGKRCVAAKNLPRFDAEQQSDFVSMIEARDFNELSSFIPPRHEDAAELSLRLMSCPACQGTQVLTLNRIAWEVDSNGRATVKIKPLVNQLLITLAEAEQIKCLCDLIRKNREKAEAIDSGEEQGGITL